jgi:hypothetical protein
MYVYVLREVLVRCQTLFWSVATPTWSVITRTQTRDAFGVTRRSPIMTVIAAAVIDEAAYIYVYASMPWRDALVVNSAPSVVRVHSRTASGSSEALSERLGFFLKSM